MMRFCIEKTSLNCNSFLAHGEKVSINELPRDNDDNRIIYFHSEQSMPHDSTIVHVWKTEDRMHRPRAKLYVSDRARVVGQSVLDGIRAFLERLELPGGFAVVVRNGDRTSQQFRAYSQRIVHGQGKYTAYVTTIRGEIIPKSAKRTITVVE